MAMSDEFSRRRLFSGATERLALLAFASRAAACTSASQPAGEAAPSSLAPKEAAVLLAIAETLVPKTPALAIEPAATSLMQRIDRFLATGDPLASRQLRFLLVGFEHYPQLFSTYFTRFTQLPPEARAEILTTFAESRYYAKRMIFTALKSIVCNHYFADPDVQAQLGYAPACHW